MCKYGEQVVWDYLSVILYSVNGWLQKKKKTALTLGRILNFSVLYRQAVMVMGRNWFIVQC